VPRPQRRTPPGGAADSRGCGTDRIRAARDNSGDHASVLATLMWAVRAARSSAAAIAGPLARIT